MRSADYRHCNCDHLCPEESELGANLKYLAPKGVGAPGPDGRAWHRHGRLHGPAREQRAEEEPYLRGNRLSNTACLTPPV